MNLNDLKGKKILMAVSGGLDSCTITHWLSEHSVKVIAYTADLGQPDEEQIEDVRDRMLSCGATEMILGDLKDEIATAGMQVIQARARYEGGYWNTTGIARHVVVESMIPMMQQRDIEILGHGATGRGNDQVRFELAAQMLDPRVRVYAPWRDSEFLEAFGGRKEMIEYCKQHGLPVRATLDSPYSTDSNVLGLTHEAGELEALTTPTTRIKAEMGNFPMDAPEQASTFKVRFEKGKPIAINGTATSPFEAIQAANAIAGEHGIGIGLHAVENRFVGIKSRGVYEAPGMEVLGQCYDFLIQLVIDRRCRKMYESISSFIAEQIYQGYWFDTGTRASWAFVEHLNQLATGTIEVSLFKGNVIFQAAHNVPHSLYNEDTASMEDIGEFDHLDSQGFIGVLGVSARALNHAGQTGA